MSKRLSKEEAALLDNIVGIMNAPISGEERMSAMNQALGLTPGRKIEARELMEDGTWKDVSVVIGEDEL